MSRHPLRRRTPTLLALAGLGALAVVAGAPSGCSHAAPVETQPAPEVSGVGDPCIPPDEADPNFGGFAVAQEFIVAADFAACQTGTCLVNHFQGRVSCPEGQSPAQIVSCNGPIDTSTCKPGEECVPSDTFAPACCDPAKDDTCAAPSCPAGTQCGVQSQLCECANDQTINGVAFFCGPADPSCTGSACSRVLHSYVCHRPGNCQSSSAPSPVNSGKQCCVPGTDTPVSVPVCGQCDAVSNRDAESVYCSCRCAPAAGAPAEPDAKLCSCPNGFTCSEIREYFGLGDASLTGSYCIKAGSAYNGSNTCGAVVGYDNPATCAGVGTSP